MTLLRSAASALCALMLGQTTLEAHAGPVPASSEVDWVAGALPSDLPPPTPGGYVSTGDLLRLRDLGGLALSPDGKWLAFSVRQADLAANEYRLRWFVAPAAAGARPTALELDGGQPLTTYSGGLPHGYMPPESAKWSPDGSRFAFRRRVGDRIELWTAVPGARTLNRVFDGTPQVEAFTWSPGGVLIFRTGFHPDEFARRADAEASHGWLLDGRMTLWAARTPSPLAPACGAAASAPGCDVRVLAADVDESTRPATPAEVADLNRALQPSARIPSRRTAKIGVASEVSPAGVVAWAETIEATRADNNAPLRRVWISTPRPQPCAVAACVGQYIRMVGLARDGRAVWFVKRVSKLGDEVHGPLDENAVYVWRSGTTSVRTVIRGPDLLEDCKASGRRLFCIRSSATRPPHIVAIDLNNGAIEVVADPNPVIATKAFPRIRTILLEDADGNRGYARLVYPNGHRPGRRYPLVIVTYLSQGFLRGGVGEEYPILPLAAQGFFVLSINMPDDLRARRDLDRRELMRRDRVDRTRQAKAVGAIEGALDKLIAEGLVDDQRIAITGLSYGAELVHYALQRSDRYAAAIASQGAKDVTYLALFPEGELRVSWMAALNAETILPRPGSVILDSAWSQQPGRLRAPLLLNLGQHEALFGFEGFAALKHEGRPLEVRVFPDEGHVKYHPRSFAGVYDNNIMWLKFWLLDAEEPGAAFREQYDRWRKMRVRLRSERLEAPADGAHSPG